MSITLTAIGLDADDTLWHNERFFSLTQDHFADLLRAHTDKDHLMERLLISERRNLPHYGFGIKGFTLSMIETAIEVTQGKVPASVIQEILHAGRDMLSHPIELLPHVEQTLETLKKDFKLILVTKGDLLDQQRKLAQSGLRDHFDAIEIVSNKNAATYVDIFQRHGTGPDHGMMAGNSMASDVVPMIDAGGWGVFIPHEVSWAIEHAETPDHALRYRELPHLGALPTYVEELLSGQE